MSFIAIADRDQEHVLHEPQSFIRKYVWSQDHKVIAIQYAAVAISIGVLAVVMSMMMRLQLGFPDTFSLIGPERYSQFITMRGMIMAVYPLKALFLVGFGDVLVPLAVRPRSAAVTY